MTIRTSGGHIVETLPAHGKFSPYRDIDDMWVIRVAVDGQRCPEIQRENVRWEDEKATHPEAEFWDLVAEDALNAGRCLGWFK